LVISYKLSIYKDYSIKIPNSQKNAPSLAIETKPINATAAPAIKKKGIISS
jgi:hypothetical protein